MQKAIVIRGRLADPRHIELDEPVDEMRGDVEITLRPANHADRQASESIFEFITSLPPGRCSKDEIDARLAEERVSWGAR